MSVWPWCLSRSYNQNTLACVESVHKQTGGAAYQEVNRVGYHMHLS